MNELQVRTNMRGKISNAKREELPKKIRGAPVKRSFFLISFFWYAWKLIMREVAEDLAFMLIFSFDNNTLVTS